MYDRDRQPSQPPATAGPLPDALKRALARVRRRLWWFGALHLLGLALAAAGLAALPLLLLLGAWPLPYALRIAAAGLVVLGAAGALGRRLVALVQLGRPVALARLIEDAAPVLGDRLTSSVLLADALPAGASVELARSHFDRTAVLVEGSAVLRQCARRLWHRVWPALTLGLIGALVAAGIGWRLSGALRRGCESLRPPSRAAAIPEVLPPLVTDIALTYRYPAYLQREPRSVEGTTGDIFAPRGTEVVITGLADRAIDSAALVIGERRVALAVTPPRQLSGALLVSEESRYRFALGSGLGE
ncbi:MAG: hypothetical protein JXR83_13960, partial [Deltaproteobacteria bacterium]|nr:hypothetical protein [Deltaproteobacteria bacterium]